jgi:hypothetical protein
MTLNVYAYTDRTWPERVFNMPEANAVRDGGNEIDVRSTDWRNGLEISINNDDFRVNITHKTAAMLVDALLSNEEAEYFLYKRLSSRLKWGEVKYPACWQRLGEEMA